MHKRSSLGESTEPATSRAEPGRELPVPGAGRAEGGTAAAPGTGPVPAPRRGGTRTLMAPMAGASLGPLGSSGSAGVYTHPPPASPSPHPVPGPDLGRKPRRALRGAAFAAPDF